MRSVNIPLVAGLIFSVLSVALSIIAWTKSSKLLLPLATTLPALSTFVPFILAVVTPLISLLHTRLQRSPYLPLLTLLDTLLTSLPAILAALSSTYYTPEGLATCRLDGQWQSFWREKNGDAIRRIQDRLRCCGYRSVQDRAWPFDGKCEQVLGYDQSCIAPWAKEERSAAIFVFVSSVLAVCLKVLLSSRQFGTGGQVRRGNLRQPNFSANFTRALPGSARTVPPSEDGGPARIEFTGERYTDNEAEERATGGDADAQVQTQEPAQEQVQGDNLPDRRPNTGTGAVSTHSHEDPEEHDILHGGFR